jgi:hypothetical protein
MTQISLSELHKVKHISVFDNTFPGLENMSQLYELRYKLISGLPFYEVIFCEDDIENLSSNNIVDLIGPINEHYPLEIIL